MQKQREFGEGIADKDLIDIYIYGSQNFGPSKAKSYYTELHNAFLWEFPY
jgi:plasmid stabilization system protein ParE